MTHEFDEQIAKARLVEMSKRGKVTMKFDGTDQLFHARFQKDATYCEADGKTTIEATINLYGRVRKYFG